MDKPTSKKLILIPKTEEKQANPRLDEENSNIKSTIFNFQFLDERTENQLMSIDEPSLEYMNNESELNGQVINDLVVIGKHIQPIENTKENCYPQMDDIDEILYENYQFPWF